MIGGLPFWFAVPADLLALLAGVAVFNHVLREFFPLDTEPKDPSAGYDEATARRAKWLRAFDCLPKPFACRGLVEVVRAAIASKKVCRTVLRSWSPSRCE